MNDAVVELAAVLHDVDDWKYRSVTDDASLSHAQARPPPRCPLRVGDTV